MKLQNKLFITLRVLFTPKAKTSVKKKIEIWQRDLSPYQQFKINSKIKWRRFDTQTRGMGLMLVVLLGIMIIANMIPFTVRAISEYLDNTKYKSALDSACKIQDFYALNFKSCEDIGVRP